MASSDTATDSAPTRAVRLFGTEEPVPATHALHAGALGCTLDAGNLRHIRLAGREAIRAVSFIVRNRNWGTYNPEIGALEIEQRADGFTVRYEAVCADDGQRLRYRSLIEGRASGELVFEAEAEALTDFLTARTGFVVLHGVEGIAGAPVRVLHTDSREEQARFPELIDPMCPFQDIRALTHELLPGVAVTCRMEGDTFEMEDQRNWTDASYKTYVRPLALPWPYVLEAGEKLAQRVVLVVEGALPAAGAGASGVTVAVGAPTGAVLPRMGLALPAEHVDAALAGADLLRRAGPSFLVGHLDLRVPTHDAGLLGRYRRLGEAIGAELVLEAIIPCRDGEGRPSADLDIARRDLARLAGLLAEAGIAPGRIAVTPASDLGSTLPGGTWPAAPDATAFHAAARAALPGVVLGGGMLSYFTELNRKRPPASALDFICHTTCPLVHAGDDLSLTETLEALPSVFRSVRAFAGGKPYWLFPTTISMRQNPYGAAPAENPRQGRVAMARVDPRERGLIGAAWYAGYLALAAAHGLDAVTLMATTGPSGILAGPAPWPQPWFDESRAPLRPSFHVFREHARFQGAPLLETTSSAPTRVQALALTSAEGRHLWLTNLTGEAETVEVTGLDGAATAHAIDEAGFVELCGDAEAFGRRGVAVEGGRITLGAYAAVRIDVEG